MGLLHYDSHDTSDLEKWQSIFQVPAAARAQGHPQAPALAESPDAPRFAASLYAAMTHAQRLQRVGIGTAYLSATTRDTFESVTESLWLIPDRPNFPVSSRASPPSRRLTRIGRPGRCATSSGAGGPVGAGGEACKCRARRGHERFSAWSAPAAAPHRRRRSRAPRRAGRSRRPACRCPALPAAAHGRRRRAASG